MTNQRDKATDEPAGGVDPLPPQPDGQVSLARRNLLRGAGATVPVILTLSSGSALAASSNLIGTMQTANGDVMCLDPSSTDGALYSNPNIYDLGSPPYAEVTRIPATNNYRTSTTPRQTLKPADVCKYKGTVEVQYNGAGGWKSRTRKPGAMVSAAACASFGTRIVKTDI